MTIPELIGFLLAMAALLYSFIHRMLEARKQALDPEGYAREQKKRQEEQEQAYKEMLESLGIPVPEELEEKPEPKREERKKKVQNLLQLSKDLQKEGRRQVKKDFELHSAIEQKKHKSNVEQQQLETTLASQFGEGYGQGIVDADLQGVERATSRTKNSHTKIHKLVDSLPKKKDLLVYREVFGPPRAFQPWDGETR